MAYLDPNTNGDAVYTARVMLNIDPTDIGLDYAKHPTIKPQPTTENTVKVYPNPANTQFTIAFKDVINSNAIVELYGSMGNMVLIDYMQKGTYIKNIDVSKLNSGLYFYNISINGAKVSSGKLTIINN